jgi:putative ABC transport system permease protein
MFDTLLQDARFAVRMLRKSPLFTLTAALSLAIGIGANATIFSVGSAMLLRPMPGISGSDRLVDIGRHRGDDDFDTISYPNYLDIRDRATSFTGIYGHTLEPAPISLTVDGDAQRSYGGLVTGNYFETLNVRPALGRLLRREDDGSPGSYPVAVLSHDLWVERFGSEPTVIGRQVTINGFPFAIVGVAPRGFQGTTILKADVWLPMSMMTSAMPSRRGGDFTDRRATWLFMGGRLREGVTLEQANAELATIAATLEREHPAVNTRLGLKAHPVAIIPGITKIIAGFIGLLMAIVTLLLLIACVNLAGMLLARGAARGREIAVRLAIGAGQGRIARQLFTETAVLFLIGAAAGLALSQWLTKLLLSVLPQLPVPLSVEISTDWRVVLFTVAMSLVASLVCGLAPALQARRTSLVPSLKGDSLAGQPSKLRLRNVFVVGQVTLSLVLVIAAGLFMRALNYAASVPTGFDQRHVEVVALDLALARYDAGTGRVFIQELLERARALPMVESAAVAVDLPLDGNSMGFGTLKVPGAPGADRDGDIVADWNLVEPGFFDTLGMRLVRGRDFDRSDTSGAPPVIIVNEAFARAAWPDGDAIGRQVESDVFDKRSQLTVVGVAADARMRSLGEPARPYVFLPLAQRYRGDIRLLAKTTGQTAVGEIRSLLRSMDPNLPVTATLPLSDVTALGTIPQRIASAISGTLGIVGLLLAAIGIYGVTSYAVNQRTREIGIRVALGADHKSVMRLMLHQGLVLAGIGVLIGVTLAAAGAQLIRSLLYGISGLDPITFGGAALVFALIALIASYIPARRALAVDPMVALRNE